MADEKDPPAPTPEDMEKYRDGYRSLVRSHNKDLGKVSSALYGENVTLRKRLAEAEAKINSGVVLSGDDAKAWEAYRKLGKPEDLTKAIDDGKAATEKAATYERREAIAKAAEPHGYKASLLEPYIPADASIEVKAEKGKDGKEARVAYVTPKDGKPTPLPDFLKAAAPDLAEVLSQPQPAPRPNAGPTPGPRIHRPMPAPGERSHDGPAPEAELFRHVGGYGL